MLFFRIFQHLLPRAEAWKVTIEKTLRNFFLGLSAPMDTARLFLDIASEDYHPTTTRELAEWEWQFGIYADTVDANRRLDLAASWQATGGQSPSYIQSQLVAAGFTTLYVHEWWSSGPPYIARDPRNYTKEPRIGEFQCYKVQGDDQSQCAHRFSLAGDPIDQAQCSRLLVNDPGYLVNETLNHDAPPPVPDDPSKWPYFLYFCAQTFGTKALIDADRLPELKRLLLKICPEQHWIVLMVRFSAATTEVFTYDIGNGYDVTVWKHYV
jgi:hypothetical protein